VDWGGEARGWHNVKNYRQFYVENPYLESED